MLIIDIFFLNRSVTRKFMFRANDRSSGRKGGEGAGDIGSGGDRKQ